MSRKAVGGILVAIGLILIVAGIVVMMVVVPSMKVWPDDVDTTRTFSGPFMVLDTTTFQPVSFDNVTLTRHVTTEEIDGDYALVREEVVFTAGDTQIRPPTVKHYAIDRETMEAVPSGYPDAWAETEGFWTSEDNVTITNEAGETVTIEGRDGIILSWPLDTEDRNYSAWSDDFGIQIDLVYVGKEEHNGIDTYHFTSTGPEHVISDFVVNNILQMPPALPGEAFLAVLSGSPMASTATMLQPVVDAYGQPIPLVYYYNYDADYWVEPQTGVLIDTRKHEIRTVGVGSDFTDTLPIPAMQEQLAAARIPIFDLDYAQDADSVDDATDDAEEVIGQLNLYGVYLPAIAMIVGVLIIIVGGYFLISKSKAAA